MKVPLWKMTKSDLIQWQIPSTHPHNSSHSMTLIHKSALFRDGVYTSNNIFIHCPRTILSSWSQWSQTYPGLQGLASGTLYNRTAGNESTPTEKCKNQIQFSDRFHRHTHTIHHIPWRPYTKVHCSGMASTLQQHFLISAQELFSPVDHNGHKHILVCRVLVGNYTTGQQGMKVPLWKITISDTIQWQIPSTHPHNSLHSTTLKHILSIASLSLHDRPTELTDGQLYNI